MKSIQSKLATGLLISLIVVFLILGVTVSSNIQKLSENYIASRLEHDIESVVAAISFGQNNTLTINDQYLNAIYKRPYSGHYYVVQYNNTLYRSRSLWDKSLSLPDETSNKYLISTQAGPEKQSLITISRKFIKQNQNITISIAEDLTPIITDINKFKNYFYFLGIFILFTLLMIQFIVLRTGLKPLRKIQSDLNKLETGEINELSSEVPAELKAVVSEVNHLSLALSKRLQRSRNALSDLSHAIKKPLTLLQNFSDKDSHKLDKESKVFLNNQILSIQNITDRILKRARVAGTSKLNNQFNLNEDLPLLIKTISTMYPDKNINLELNVPEKLESYIDREDMLELLGNLVDNAWKWAKTKIIITIKISDKICITIEDDGAGADQQSLNELSQRGVRLDESVDGYGFGLAISSDIILDYQGSIAFNHSEELGGLSIEIMLPIKQ